MGIDSSHGGRKRLRPETAPHQTHSTGPLHDRLRDHRQMGIVQVYLDFIASEKLLAKTNASPLKGRVKVLGARKQGPSAKGGEHAAHSHPAAGWVSDFIEARKTDLRNSQDLTPHQLRFSQLEEESDLDNTFDDTRNTTENLPDWVNLRVDAAYEKEIRPTFRMFIEEVASGRMTAEAAAEGFRLASLEFFTKKEQTAKDPKLKAAFAAEKEGCLEINWDDAKLHEANEVIQERALRRRRTE